MSNRVYTYAKISELKQAPFFSEIAALPQLTMSEEMKYHMCREIRVLRPNTRNFAYLQLQLFPGWNIVGGLVGAYAGYGFNVKSGRKKSYTYAGKYDSENKGRKRKKKSPFWSLLVLLILIGGAFGGKYTTGKWFGIIDDQNVATGTITATDPDSIPEYSGADYVVLNHNKPGFTEEELRTITGEHYSSLDLLGRCGTAVAMLSREMMPTEERGEIGQIKPSGWVQKKYEGIVNSQPPYLYNRCHLIAYALTGQNANEKNLITGTRYFNVNVMLPFEEQVMRYLDYSDNHVLYRVTPYFKGTELVARGVEMEAYSVEDHGVGVSYHVFVYNQQPGIKINYQTGDSWVKG